MKRFWKAAEAVETPDGWAVRLDGRPVKTPGRYALVVPSRALGEAIAAEWNAVEDMIDPRAMSLTGLANAAIERVAADPAEFARGLAAYGESDLACYRAEGPSELVARQCARWDALLDWARRHYGIEFATTQGVIHVAQPGETVDALRNAVQGLDPFRLAGLSPLVTIGGSLVAALAVLEDALDPGSAWEVVTIDDSWQMEQWGEDAEAVAALDARRRDFFAAAQFLELLDAG